MLTTIITPPATEPITFRQAKQWLRLDDNECEKDWVCDNIKAVRETAETISGLSLISRTVSDTWQQDERYGTGFFATPTYDLWYERKYMLSQAPVASIDSIIDGNGNAITAYQLNQHGDRTSITFANRPILPFTVTYVAGYGDATQVPAGIKANMLAHLATLYSYRDLMGKQPDLDAVYARYKTGGLIG